MPIINIFKYDYVPLDPNFLPTGQASNLSSFHLPPPNKIPKLRDVAEATPRAVPAELRRLDISSGPRVQPRAHTSEAAAVCRKQIEGRAAGRRRLENFRDTRRICSALEGARP